MEGKAVVKTVMGGMRRQAEAGNSKAGTGSCTDCGILHITRFLTSFPISEENASDSLEN